MKVYILGCGDAFGSGGRNHSGYLVEYSDRLFLLDCGPTTLLSMKRAGLDPQRLDTIILSHLHGDHFGGIPFFFLEFVYGNPRTRPLTIAGPLNTEERVRSLTHCMYSGILDHATLFSTQFHILESGKQETIDGIDILPFRVPHQVQDISLGLKIRYQEKQILYSGDSSWTDQFVTHAKGVDLFICECTYFEDDTQNHMCYQKIRQNLHRLNCKNLLLTHMGEEMLAHRLELPVKSAEDGMVLTI